MAGYFCREATIYLYRATGWGCSKDRWPEYSCRSITMQMGAISWYKLVYILLSAKRRAYVCRSTAMEMGGLSRCFSKVPGSIWLSWLEPIFGKGMRRSTFQWKKGLFSEKGEAMQWMRNLERICTGKAIQWSRPGHSVNRSALKTEKLLCWFPSPKSALTWVMLSKCAAESREHREHGGAMMHLSSRECRSEWFVQGCELQLPRGDAHPQGPPFLVFLCRSGLGFCRACTEWKTAWKPVWDRDRGGGQISEN